MKVQEIVFWLTLITIFAVCSLTLSHCTTDADCDRQPLVDHVAAIASAHGPCYWTGPDEQSCADGSWIAEYDDASRTAVLIQHAETSQPVRACLLTQHSCASVGSVEVVCAPGIIWL
jgi:hypothetical protein